MTEFSIEDIRISWDVDDNGDGTSSVRESVAGIERCFVYGPVPNDDVPGFLEERQAVMGDMAKRFRRDKMN